jgi:hypothetical protein
MNKLKTFFNSLKNSLINPQYYREVEKESFWSSFKYLWFLLFILIFIKMITLGSVYLISRPLIKPGVNKIMTSAQNFYPKKLELKIQNGQLSTNMKEPYVIDVEKNKWQTDRHLLIIDTKGLVDDYPNYNTYVLATKNAVVYPAKSPENKVKETSVFYFRDIKQNFTLNEKVYNNLLNKIRPYTYKVPSFLDVLVVSVIPFFLFFGSFFWTTGTLMCLLFMTLFVWIINKLFKKGYSYRSLYRMGMHAVTWPILLGQILGYAKSPFPRFYFWIFTIFMIIVLFSEQKKLPVAKKPAKKRKG